MCPPRPIAGPLKLKHRPVRELKVHLSPHGYPCIQLAGRWVEEQAGFSRGAKVSVKVDPGRLVVELAPTDYPASPVEE